MTTRTITIEDDEYEALEDEIGTLRARVDELEDSENDLSLELDEITYKWNSKTELLKRIGELS